MSTIAIPTNESAAKTISAFVEGARMVQDIKRRIWTKTIKRLPRRNASSIYRPAAAVVSAAPPASHVRLIAVALRLRAPGRMARSAGLRSCASKDQHPFTGRASSPQEINVWGDLAVAMGWYKGAPLALRGAVHFRPLGWDLARRPRIRVKF